MPPAPQRRRATTWRDYSRQHKEQLLADDCRTIETRCPTTLHVLCCLGVGMSPRCLSHDRDAKCPPSFDTVFVAEGIAIVRTPYRAPTANAYAERCVRSVREEYVDRLLIADEGHLRQVLADFVAHDNRARPHWALGQQTPIPYARRDLRGPISRREVLGDLIHEYDREAA